MNMVRSSASSVAMPNWNHHSFGSSGDSGGGAADAAYPVKSWTVTHLVQNNQHNHLGLQKQPPPPLLPQRPYFQISQSSSVPRSTPHLFRHYDDVSFDSWLRCCDPLEFIESIGLENNNIINVDKMMPWVSNLNVHAQLAPHIRFAVSCWNAGSGRLAWMDTDDSENENEVDEECHINSDWHHNLRMDQKSVLFQQQQEESTTVPFEFFLTCNLDRTLAPWHAYLEYSNLLHGEMLVQDKIKLIEFLVACKTGKVDIFIALCEKWSMTSGMFEQTPSMNHRTVIPKFLRSFQRGLLPLAKNAISTDLQSIGCSNERMCELLIQHGANFLQHDKLHKMTLLHWSAAVPNNLSVLQQLARAIADERYHDDDDDPDRAVSKVLLDASMDAKQWASVLHYAVVGVNPHRIGNGGDRNTIEWILQQAPELIYTKTSSHGDSVFHWAVLVPENLELLQLLKKYVDPEKVATLFTNRKGQTLAHWAAIAGTLETCQLLQQQWGVDFYDALDDSGKSPLEYAHIYRRQEVVDWLLKIKSPPASHQHSVVSSSNNLHP
jgi:ankyrin repeat protein